MKLLIVFAVIIAAVIAQIVFEWLRKRNDDNVIRIYSVENDGNWVKFLLVYKDNSKKVETVRWGSKRFRKLMRMVEGK